MSTAVAAALGAIAVPRDRAAAAATYNEMRIEIILKNHPKRRSFFIASNDNYIIVAN